ncbi:hypothetical protein Nepgr_013644 [Nepenthes gracilis]|uniref:Uncharacterized protein n=1 Tax=Nepenthes gracilis TaxID=150966 RepID=A0AAD3XP65_NEPGR|nr:hypothetical protein Nepgr_013644 [Nepenthes gracilis]
MGTLSHKFIMLGPTQWRGTGGFGMLSSSALCNLSSTRDVIGIIKLIKDNSAKSNVKRALLSARKKERIKLPKYEDSCRGKIYHVSEFLNDPAGVEALLNVDALESWKTLGSNTYRCTLPGIQLLNFEVAPVLDLQVNRTSDNCTVELLSCKFQGSDILERQNKHFSAFMENCITWDRNDSESFMDVDVKLDISLEIYNQPFLLLPVSAIEGPGNMVMQALLDRFVPLLLQKLLKDYDSWVQQQRKVSP